MQGIVERMKKHDAWPARVTIAKENRIEMPKEYYDAITNLNLKHNNEDYCLLLNPVSYALDKIQASGVNLSEAVNIWHNLSKEHGLRLSIKQMELLAKRRSMALTPMHLFSFHVDPRYRHENLMKTIEIESALGFASSLHPSLIANILQFRVADPLFTSIMLTKEALSAVNPASSWSLATVDESHKDHFRKVLSCMCTTAELERLFSTFGFVHFSLRNRLGIEKNGKLVFCFRVLNH